MFDKCQHFWYVMRINTFEFRSLLTLTVKSKVDITVGILIAKQI